MSKLNRDGRFGPSLFLAAVLVGSSVIASAAFAGECPADQKKPNAREAVDFKPVGVTDTVIASIDVAKAPFNINERLFRMRKLTIEPNGIVPWHSHADRPAIIYIIEGEITNMLATAQCRSCTRPVMWWPRRLRSPIGGRISATRPSCSSPPIC
jgi:hypothetical protein